VAQQKRRIKKYTHSQAIRKTLIVSSVSLALGTPVAEAALVTNVLGANTWHTDTANFTMLAPNGGAAGGSNLVVMQWDGNAYNSSTDYTGPGGATNVSVTACCTAGASILFGHTWTAHDVQMFVPGSYSFNVALGGGGYANSESGSLNVTVPSGDFGMHMLWDWNGSTNIDIFVVLAQNSIFGSGLLSGTDPTCLSSYTGTITKNCLYDYVPLNYGPGPSKNQVWMLASADGNGDGIMGIPMASGGPLPGYNANFNATLIPTPKAVPVPAAAWLFGSGLIGLLGAARRRKQ
jgi:hypothetical protein